MHRILSSIAAGCVAAIAVASAASQTPQLKTYSDPRYGVTFRYPAAWKADPKLGFYLGTLILQGPDGAPDVPLTKVGFERTLGSDGAFPDKSNLDGVEFVYLVVPQTTAEACYKRLPEQDGETKKSELVIHGVTWKRMQGGDAGLGHGAYRDMYASYIGSRCYLFEGGIHTLSANNTKYLQGAALMKLQNQLAAVMRSVTIAPLR